jgi:hypothetical protein
MARDPEALAHTSGSTGDITLAVAKAVALAVSLAVALYVAAEAEPSPPMTVVMSYAPVVTVILWLQKDAQRTGVGAVLDLGYFLCLAWPVVIPWYAFRTRGRGGWRLIVGLFALIAGPWATGVLVSYIRWRVLG